MSQNKDLKDDKIIYGKLRRMTDVIPLLLFICCIAIYLSFMIYVISIGDYKKVVLPYDNYGRICGVDESVKNLQFAYYFDWFSCINDILSKGISSLFYSYQCSSTRVCVESCPLVTVIHVNERNTICVNNTIFTSASLQDAINNGTCAPFVLKSDSILRRCVPDLLDIKNRSFTYANGTQFTGEQLIEEIKKLDQLFDFFNTFALILEEIFVFRYFAFVLAIVAAFISLFYIIFLKFLIIPIMYGIPMILVGSTSYGIYFSVTQYIASKNNQTIEGFPEFLMVIDNGNIQSLFLASATILGILTLVLIIVMVCLCTDIRETAKNIKNACKTLISCPSILFLPIIVLILICGWFSLHIFGILSIFSLNDKQIENLFPVIISDCLKYNYHCVFNMFSSNPLAYFLIFVSSTMLGWIVLYHYCLYTYSISLTFSLHHQLLKTPTFIAIISLIHGIIFHTGSIALGAFLILLFILITFFIYLLDRKYKESNNYIARFAIKVALVIANILSKIMKFINENALIVMTIIFKNYCISAFKATTAHLFNISKVVMIMFITWLITFTGESFVGILTGLIAWVYMTYRTEFSFITFLTILSGLVGYLIASYFLNIINIGVKTQFFIDEYLKEIPDENNKRQGKNDVVENPTNNS